MDSWTDGSHPTTKPGVDFDSDIGRLHSTPTSVESEDFLEERDSGVALFARALARSHVCLAGASGQPVL